MMEKIKFEAGKPVELALKYAGGKTVPGRYGEQAVYSTTDDRVFYLDPEPASDVDHRLMELGIQPREWFRITKIIHARGGGSSFRIERCGEPAPPPARETNGYAAPESQLERDLRESRELIERRKREPDHDDRQRTTYPGIRPDPSSAAGHERGAVASQASAPPVRALQQQPNDSAMTTAHKFMAAYQIAVDVLLETQVYAKRQGLDIVIRCEDVRCLAATLVISQNGGGR